jgi:signal transduction histidine kinase
MADEHRLRRAVSTVRFRITALATVAVAVVLAVTAIGLVVVQRRALTNSLDEALATEARAVVARVEDGGAATTAVDPPSVDDDAVAQVVVGDEVAAASRPGLDRRPLAPAPSGTTATRTSDSVPGGDGAFRIVSQRVTGSDGGGGDGGPATVVHVAAPLDDVDDSVGLLARSLALAVPAVTALLAALVWALAGRTLRPVESIRREVAQIGATDLRRRVPVPPGDDEVARLARTMNAMLERVEDASDRQRRFVGDASHELRTPLARMRSEIEVDLAHPDRADLAATHRSVLDETIGMQHLVDDLLHLARADGARDPADHPDGDGADAAHARLDEVVAGEVSRARAGSPVALDVLAAARVNVAGDPAELRRVIANLLDNATRHARSHVEVTVADAGGVAEVAVTDDGPGVPPDQAERIFERFARLDDARSSTEGGTGLGLAIAREIAARHGGTLTLDTAHRAGARFVLRLPSSAAPRPVDR